MAKKIGDAEIHKLYICRTEPTKNEPEDSYGNLRKVVARLADEYPKSFNFASKTSHDIPYLDSYLAPATTLSGFQFLSRNPRTNKYHLGLQTISDYSESSLNRAIAFLQRHSWGNVTVADLGQLEENELGFIDDSIRLFKGGGEYSINGTICEHSPIFEDHAQCLTRLNKWLTLLGLRNSVELEWDEKQRKLLIDSRQEKFKVSCFQNLHLNNLTVTDVSQNDSTVELFMKLVKSACVNPIRTRLVVTLPTDEYETRIDELNEFTKSWSYSADAKYEEGFDPYQAPENSKQKLIRYPVLKWNSNDMPVLHATIVHSQEGSFLEILTIRSKRKLKEFIEIADVPCEIWEGPLHHRWDGKSGVS